MASIFPPAERPRSQAAVFAVYLGCGSFLLGWIAGHAVRALAGMTAWCLP